MTNPAVTTAFVDTIAMVKVKKEFATPSVTVGVFDLCGYDPRRWNSRVHRISLRASVFSQQAGVFYKGLRMKTKDHF